MKKAYISLNQISGYSLAATLALDLFWNLFDLSLFLAIFLAPVIFALCFTLVVLVQRYVSHDEWGEALAKALILGFIAAIPFSVTSMLAAGVYGALYGTYHNDPEVVLLGQLTQAWKQLEKILRSPFRANGYRNNTIEEIIDFWYERGMISQMERDGLHKVRILRNRTMHTSNEQKLSNDELAALIKQIYSFSTTLEHRLGD